MMHVTKSVTGRHQISDEIAHVRAMHVTKSVTTLLTIPEGERGAKAKPQESEAEHD